MLSVTDLENTIKDAASGTEALVDQLHVQGMFEVKTWLRPYLGKLSLTYLGK